MIKKRNPRSTSRDTVRLWRMIIFGGLLLAIAFLVFYLLLQGKDVAVLNPQGPVAAEQKRLIIFATALGSIVVIPVFVMLFGFAWRYRDTNKKAKYTPDDDHNIWIETLWWGIPIVIILILSVVTWRTTHNLDPYKSMDFARAPLRVRVVALQWKWLFIYPDQGIVSMNELHIPAQTPVYFELTADAPMNGFWIPSLGSQTYAMPGMSSKLILEANNAGEYYGSSTNISGRGYADMHFRAIATSRQDFDQWARSVAASASPLDWDGYQKVAAPSQDDPVQFYTLGDQMLYDKIIAKYMHGDQTPEKTEEGASMNHEGH